MFVSNRILQFRYITETKYELVGHLLQNKKVTIAIFAINTQNS